MLILLWFLVVSPARAAPPIDPAYGKPVGSCEVREKPSRHVFIFKQWHLSPAVKTAASVPSLPQARNQTAIYRQLDAWISKGELKTVTAFRDFRLFITAEPSPSVTQPTGEALMWADVKAPPA